MTPTNAELLDAHSKECGSHEFILRLTEGKKQYCCQKCSNQIAEEPDATLSPATQPVSETRKAA